MYKKLAGAILGAAILTGCATPPQQPIAMSDAARHAQGTRIGITTTMPKVDTTFPGAACLLCLAAASMTNSSLTTYTQTLPSDDIAHINADLAERLAKRGYTPVTLPAEFKIDDLPKGDGGPNKSVRDFRSLRGKYNIDKLVVVQIEQIGITRNYSGYIPTGAPQGSITGSGYLVNLADNSLEWYVPIKQVKSAAGEWDEAPRYPGLTNAYYQAVEGTRDDVLKPFSD